MKIQTYLLYSAFACAPVLCASAAGETDTLSANGRTHLYLSPMQRVGAGIYDASPAANLYRHTLSLSTVSGQYRYGEEDNAILRQQGDGLNQGTFNAESYLRLNSHSAVWGNMEYNHGQKRNVLWNTTSDYQLLAPYTLGDLIGGDMKTEHYIFTGGYARRDGIISYGAEVSYRAQLEYDEKDPRPSNTVSDLSYRGSVGVSLGNYLFEAAAGGRTYNQEATINVVYTDLLPPVYSMMGLGNYWGQSSGSYDVRDRLYEGNGYNVSIGFLPRSADTGGWYAGAAYEYFHTNSFVPGQADVELTRLKSKQVTGNVAYRSNRDTSLKWAIEGKGGYELRQGFENITLTLESKDYRVYGTLPQYLERNVHGELKALIGIEPGNYTCYLRPHATYRRSKSSHAYPASNRKVENAKAGADLDASWQGRRWMIHASAGIERRWNLDKDLSLASATADWAIEMTGYGYSRDTACYTGYHASLRADCQLQEWLSAFLSAGWQSMRFGKNDRSQLLEVSCGFNF